MSESAVLRGVRVLDLGHFVAGPLAAVMLADQGADVIRIDRPGAGVPAEDALLHRGKRRITLDLKDPADAAVARDLALRADVLIENFRPGVLDRLGLGWAELGAANPRLVYCSMPGFPATDPRAGIAGWEGVIAAATGNCRIRAGYVPTGWDPGRPTYTALPVASNFAAFCGAFAIVAALTRRHRTGAGDRIETSLYAAMFEAIGGSGAYPLAQGLPPERAIAGGGSGTYRCADGRYVQFNPIGATSRFLRWFLDAAGVGHWVAEGLADRARTDADPAAGALLRERLTALFAGRAAAEWEALANAAGVPLAAVRTTAEWMRSEQALASRQSVEVDDPVLGPLTVPGAAVVLDGTPDPSGTARHRPDEDRAAVLAERDGPPSEPVPAASHGGGSSSGSTADAGAYAGLRVLDLTQILAGPTAGRVLAELGADVTKINVPQRRVGAHGFVNRGKQTMLLDVTAARGEQVLWRLIEQADVVLHNFPAATARRYGLTYEHLRARRPDIVHVAVSCYDDFGPWAGRRGYETQGQAATGIAERAGGEHGAAVLGPYNVLDYGTGMLAAFAAALGIHRQATTGKPTGAHASLTRTGVYQQARYAILPSAGGEPRGPDALGTSDRYRYYRGADRWFFVAAEGDRWTRLLAVVSEATGGSAPEGDAEPGWLERAFAERPAAEWVRRLCDGGVAAHEVVTLTELMNDPRTRSLGLSITQVSEEVGDVVMPGPAVRAERMPVAVGAAARQPGADGREVLAGIGLAEAVPELGRAWAVQLDALPAGWEHF